MFFLGEAYPIGQLYKVDVEPSGLTRIYFFTGVALRPPRSHHPGRYRSAARTDWTAGSAGRRPGDKRRSPPRLPAHQRSRSPTHRRQRTADRLPLVTRGGLVAPVRLRHAPHRGRSLSTQGAYPTAAVSAPAYRQRAFSRRQFPYNGLLPLRVRVGGSTRLPGSPPAPARSRPQRMRSLPALITRTTCSCPAESVPIGIYEDLREHVWLQENTSASSNGGIMAPLGSSIADSQRGRSGWPCGFA